MAEITVGGLRIDTEDIDLLVLYCPLTDLDAAVKFDKELLGVMPADDPDRPYWKHRLKTHELALDIAERTLNETVGRIRRAITSSPYSLTEAAIKQARKPAKRTLKVIGDEA